MCGIFLCASTQRPKRPQCLNLNDSVTPCTFELFENDITPILSDYLTTQTALTVQDQFKLDNLPELQKLQLKLHKFKNARNSEMVAEIELQIEALTMEDIPSILDNLNITNIIVPEILARGPDYARYQEIEHGPFYLQLLSSVLSLRQPFTKQPVQGPDYILQFNGELYNDDCLQKNDTNYISEKINAALLESSSRQNAFCTVISLLDGEFAFVITDLKENKLYFGKDYVGKRSLLYCIDEDNLVISSVFPFRQSMNIIECAGHSIHIVDMTTLKLESVAYLELWDKYHSQHRIVFNPLRGQLSYDELDIRTQQLSKVISQSTLVRQEAIYPLHRNKEHLDLGVLFSGGLDCTVLAGLIASNYNKMGQKAVIDLLTVGFDNPRTGLTARGSPDRKLSERSWFELCKSFHGTSINFRLVQVDVLYENWLRHKNHVLNLTHPRSTEMDLSIAIAFYFACRACDCEALEIISDVSEVSWNDFSTNMDLYIGKTPHYTSQAKVLFSGLGADELFGGYSRHENIFHDIDQLADESLILEKYNELSNGLINDIKIIFERNLGRDDRAMSCWGKELRYPYLDNTVINFVVNKIEPQFKIKFDWREITTKKGTKMIKVYDRKHILRCSARKMGLSMAAEEIKRAIQFGAKSAKLEVGQSKVKGTDVV